MTAVPAHILIVEDNAENLELMRYLLRAFGYRTSDAGTCAQGVEAVAALHPDLVLCDVQLPDADGHELVKRVREAPHAALMPIVAVTALAMVGDRDRMLAKGFDGYLSKPIDPELFVSQVEAFLPPDRRSARGPPAQPWRSGSSEDTG